MYFLAYDLLLQFTLHESDRTALEFIASYNEAGYTFTGLSQRTTYAVQVSSL